LYEDRGYRFGSEWLFNPIPPRVRIRIEQLAKGI
jgi:hypothetical protein